MNKSKLVDELAKTEGLTLKKAELIVNIFLMLLPKVWSMAARQRSEVLVLSKSKTTADIMAEIPNPVRLSRLSQRNCLFLKSVRN